MILIAVLMISDLIIITISLVFLRSDQLLLVYDGLDLILIFESGNVLDKQLRHLLLVALLSLESVPSLGNACCSPAATVTATIYSFI